MKCISHQNDQFVFQLSKQEWPLLQAVLNQYPLVPPAHQRLSKTAPAGQNEADERLLEEALAEQRRDNRRQLDALLADPQRLTQTAGSRRLSLSAGELEWLLQVLNDVRVGSWILLGAPEKSLWDFELNETTAAHAWTMEVAGQFEAHLLAALEGGEE